MARPGDDDDPRPSIAHSHSHSHSQSHSQSHSRSVSRPHTPSLKEASSSHFAHHQRSESQVGLREAESDGEGDLPILAGEKPNVEVEYETPNTVKGIWLGTYFFFSLLLTLYNKLILGSVSAALLGYIYLLYMYIYIELYISYPSSGVH